MILDCNCPVVPSLHPHEMVDVLPLGIQIAEGKSRNKSWNSVLNDFPSYVKPPFVDYFSSYKPPFRDNFHSPATNLHVALHDFPSYKTPSTCDFASYKLTFPINTRSFGLMIVPFLDGGCYTERVSPGPSDRHLHLAALHLRTSRSIERQIGR